VKIILQIIDALGHSYFLKQITALLVFTWQI